jgi:hypothetical protein
MTMLTLKFIISALDRLEADSKSAFSYRFETEMRRPRPLRADCVEKANRPFATLPRGSRARAQPCFRRA